MQRLYWEMQNDVTVDEKISWCDSKEWGICLLSYNAFNLVSSFE